MQSGQASRQKGREDRRSREEQVHGSQTAMVYVTKVGNTKHFICRGHNNRNLKGDLIWIEPMQGQADSMPIGARVVDQDRGRLKVVDLDDSGNVSVFLLSVRLSTPPYTIATAIGSPVHPPYISPSIPFEKVAYDRMKLRLLGRQAGMKGRKKEAIAVLTLFEKGEIG